jgi:hypothetical protein
MAPRSTNPNSRGDRALTAMLAPLARTVERVMERSASKRKPAKRGKSPVALCKPVNSVEYSIAGD